MSGNYEHEDHRTPRTQALIPSRNNPASDANRPVTTGLGLIQVADAEGAQAGEQGRDASLLAGADAAKNFARLGLTLGRWTAN
jgi:hypothetical protein